jgi:hypothetical protein
MELRARPEVGIDGAAKCAAKGQWQNCPGSFRNLTRTSFEAKNFAQNFNSDDISCSIAND